MFVTVFTPLDEILSQMNSVHTTSLVICPILLLSFRLQVYPVVCSLKKVLRPSFFFFFCMGSHNLLECYMLGRSDFSLSAFGPNVMLASHLQMSQVVVLRSSSRNTLRSLTAYMRATCPADLIPR